MRTTLERPYEPIDQEDRCVRCGDCDRMEGEIHMGVATWRPKSESPKWTATRPSRHHADRCLCHDKRMAYFTARVQLDGEPSNEAYDRLHAAMRAQGYARFVKSNENNWYRLPHAEYVSQKFSTRKDAVEAAKIAATSVQKGFKVLVTEGNGLTWHNLDKVAPEVAKAG